jgi:hypothetical protein
MEKQDANFGCNFLHKDLGRLLSMYLDPLPGTDE